MAGYIKKRGNSWVVAVDLGRDADGKRQRAWRTIRGKRRDAEKLLTELLHRRDSGVDISPERLRVGGYLNQWLATHAKPNTAPMTYERYEQIVRLHLAPALGATLLAKLQPLQIQALYSELQDKGLSARTVTAIHLTLHKALKDAVGWRLVPANAADGAQPPKCQRFEPQTLEREDVKRLLAAADKTGYGMFVRLAAWTGLRSAELRGLRWIDLDLDSGMLRVSQTCQWLPRRGFFFREPKSKASARSVALTPLTVDCLKEHRARQRVDRMAAGSAYDKSLDLVFANPLGAPLPPSSARDAWNGIAKAAGVGVRLHDLRHFHASELVRQGAHMKLIQERLGHATIAVTMNVYGHLAPTMQREAADRFDRMFADG